MSKSLAICMISDDFLPVMTGVGTHLKLIAPELVRLGHRVCVITSRRKGEPEVEVRDGVTIYRVFSVRTFGFYQALPSKSTLRRILTEFAPDIVHHHYSSYLMSATYSVCTALKIRQLGTYHFGPEVLTQPAPMRPLRPFIAWLMKRQYSRFECIIAPSKSVGAQLAEAGFATKIVNISNPVAFALKKSDQGSAEGPEPVVLFAGRLGVEKNVPLLLRAFHKLAKDGVNARLRIAGQGPELATLERMVKEFGIESRVEFLGFLDHATLAKEYAACHVFVLPSVLEVQPLVALEAMAFGKPVIVTSAIAAAREIVDEEVNGYVVDPSAADPLADKLRALLADKDMRARFGRVSKEKSTEYGLEKFTGALIGLYESMSNP